MSSYSPQNRSQGQKWPFTDNAKPGSHMELIATVAVILVFILISFHLYVRYRHRNHVVITIHRGGPTPPTAMNSGLDAIAIAALPTFIYHAGSSTNGCTDECAVCLSVAEEGEIMRLLPDCKHVFHIDCIDMWLHSHSTCPVCRTSAKQVTKPEFGGLLAAPPLPERFGHGGSGQATLEGPSESSQVSREGNGSRRWLSTIEDDGVVDLERQ